MKQCVSALIQEQSVYTTSAAGLTDFTEENANAMQTLITSMPIADQHLLWVLVGMIREILPSRPSQLQEMHYQHLYHWVAVNILAISTHKASELEYLQPLLLFISLLCENEAVYLALHAPGRPLPVLPVK